MFEGWDSYFLLIGGASGALIGLLFVVTSLTTGLTRETRLRGASLYVTPIVFHFAIVVVLSGTALAPGLTSHEAAVPTGVCAIVGAIHLAYVTWGIARGRTPTKPHWSDPWCYGVAPLMVYLTLGGAAIAAAQGRSWAAEAVAGLALALLLIAVRNAWDLVTWLAPSADDDR